VSEYQPDRQLPPREITNTPVETPLPARWPDRIPLKGTYASLEPIDPQKHGADLYAAGHHPPGSDEVWTYLGYGPFSDEATFADWVRNCAASPDPIWYAIADLEQGRFLGVATFMDIQPKVGGIEIGHIWFGPELQRTRAATEALFLMMRHALDDLGYRRLQWKCHAFNQASRNAAVRLGFTFEGILYQHQITKGKNRDTAYFSILDWEWPLIRENFNEWLDPSNFDDSGKQRRSLGEMNRKLRS
jgi:RimJ/RimL family protein N-acetyltransferase